MRFAIALAFFAAATFGQSGKIVEDYLRAKTATLRAGVSEADVDRLLAYYTDDVVYEDPKVKMRVEGKDRIRSGMLSHADDYAGSAAETSITIEKTLDLANAVTAVVHEVFWAKGEKGRQKIDRKRLLVIEFRDDKICRVIDYH
jgi:ketosteroid isomerase-like protein